nr:serine hydrolase domain-containing protein [Kineococcus aurantiacus]
MERAVRGGLFPGVVAVSSTADGRVEQAAAGNLTPTSVVGLGPLTEVFTATAAHALADVGAVDLDRPTERGFTLRQLLDHTSGLPATSSVAGRDDLRPAQKLQRVLDTPLVTSPGQVVRRSAVGLVVLGALLEDATGQGLDSLVADLVTAPLHLDGPVFGAPGDGLARALARPVGHDGLHGSAGQVHAVGRALLEGTLPGGPTPLLHPGGGTCLVVVAGAADPAVLEGFRAGLVRRSAAGAQPETGTESPA